MTVRCSYCIRFLPPATETNNYMLLDKQSCACAKMYGEIIGTTGIEYIKRIAEKCRVRALNQEKNLVQKRWKIKRKVLEDEIKQCMK